METSPVASSSKTFLGALFIVVVTFAAYLPSLNGGWLWDDDVHVTKNPWLRDAEGLKRLWFDVGVTPQYYPLTHTSFWLQYQLWGADRSLPYRLVNAALHVASALLVWLILSQLGIKGAWLAGAIFAIHPVHVESVAWVTERKNALSGFLYLLGAASLLRAMRDERIDWKWYSCGAVAFVAAILSKTVAATLPAAVLLVLWWKQGGRLKLAQVLAMLPLATVGAGMGQLTAWLERNHVGARGPEYDFSFLQRVQIAGAAVWFYVYKLLMPIRLSFIYDRWDVPHWGASGYLWPALVVGVFLWLFAMRRRIGRPALVAALFFVGTLFPALGFVNFYPMRYSFVADHFQYLASIGLIALGAAMLSRLRRGAIFIPIVLAGLTWFRAEAFHDEVALWEDTLEKSPRAWIAHDQLGAIALEQMDLATALGHFAKAIEIEPNHVEGYLGFGNGYLMAGQPGAAIAQMQKAVAVAPDKPLPHFALAGLLEALGNFDGAIEEYSKTLSANPDFVPAHLKLAAIYDRQGRPELAEPHRRAGEALARRWRGSGTQPASR